MHRFFKMAYTEDNLAARRQTADGTLLETKRGIKGQTETDPSKSNYTVAAGIPAMKNKDDKG